MERGLEIILRINIESKKISEDCSSAYCQGAGKNMLTVLNQVLPIVRHRESEHRLAAFPM